jgi:hypothetical protein
MVNVNPFAIDVGVESSGTTPAESAEPLCVADSLT